MKAVYTLEFATTCVLVINVEENILITSYFSEENERSFI